MSRGFKIPPGFHPTKWIQDLLLSLVGLETSYRVGMILAIGDPAGDLKPATVPAKVRLSFGSLAHQGLAEIPKAGLRMSGRDQS